YRDSVSGGHPHHASILGEAGEGLGYLAYRLWTAQHTPRGLPVPATAVGAAPPCHPATTLECRACPPPWAWLYTPATPPRRGARPPRRGRGDAPRTQAGALAPPVHPAWERRGTESRRAVGRIVSPPRCRPSLVVEERPPRRREPVRAGGAPSRVWWCAPSWS